MSMTPLEIALQRIDEYRRTRAPSLDLGLRIDECRRTRAPSLDLSGLRLEKIPEQVFELTWLKKLDVSERISGRITEIPMNMKRLRALVDFNCSSNRISNLSVLKEIPRLRTLDCSGNQLSDLDFLKYIPHLQSLQCRCNQISDLSSLKHVRELKTLDCSSNNIINLEALQYVPSLQTLDCSSNNIINLEALQYVPSLQTLDCSSNNIINLEALQYVPSLQTLDCSSNPVNDLNALKYVPHLQSLQCRRNQISDLSSLKHVRELKTLDCSSNPVNDLNALEYVPHLQSLQCRRNQIRDLSTLKNVPQLKILDCSDNNISNMEKPQCIQSLEEFYCANNLFITLALNDLPNLQKLDCSENQLTTLILNKLPNLQTIRCRSNKINHLDFKNLLELQEIDCRINQLAELSSLRELKKLKILYFDENQIVDLIFLSELTELQEIYFQNNYIEDLLPLKNLAQLQVINCRDNKITTLSPIHEAIKSGLYKSLYVYGNQILGIPNELLKGGRGGNCLEDIKHYLKDLDNGSKKQQRLKIQLVGNGRVGKTTLAYALEHQCPPPEACTSTHGITIEEIQFLYDQNDPVILQLWDFGGQEIYHATHRIFLSNDCLYLLLWAEETEEDSNETRHPVSYWLEAIHDLGRDSLIILVKNQIDRFDKGLPIPPDLTEDTPGVSQVLQAIKISAREYWGMETINGAIQDVLHEFKHWVSIELPISWIDIQDELKKYYKENTIPFAHFKQLCIKAGVGHAEWFVGYLHKTGVLFYREGAFQDQIILNQDWVIKAVYRVFDPQDQRRFIEEDLKGRFKARHAKIIWPEVDETEWAIYLDFMRNCGICYEPNRRFDTPFDERTFIIPSLLPEDISTHSTWQKNATDWQLDIEYPFLHRSIIERIILRLGETYQGEPWRTGIFCDTEHGQVLLECVYRDKQQSTQGQLSFHLRGNQLAPLEYALRKLVSEISPHNSYQEFLSKGSEIRTPLPEFKENPGIITSLDEVKQIKEPIHIFISYSKHDKEPFRIKMERCLKNISRNRELPLVCWHDECLLSGGLVHDDILEQLEKG